MLTAPLFALLLPFTIHAQEMTIPPHLVHDQELTDSLHSIARELRLLNTFDIGDYGTETISLAVIDLNGDKPHIGGVYMDNLIYPASVYKIYVAAEVLNQVSQGRFGLFDPLVVKSPNDVDQRMSLRHDLRAVPVAGDTLSVHYLLDLMITTSSNTAANMMIDLATRDRINELIQHYGWNGSEVTRKFLPRRYEDPGYEDIQGTETCALHAADFFYRIYTNQLVNPWVSQQMMTLLGRQLDKSKLASGFPSDAMFYHKSGWWSYWTNDAGIVDDGQTRFVIAAFLPIPQNEALPIFQKLGERVFQLINERNALTPH